jgi:hypothetical protein
LRLFSDLHHMISMGSSGPKDLIRHGDRKSRAPFELSFRAPFGAVQIGASGRRVKPPSSGSCFVRDDGASWTSDRRHQPKLPFRRLESKPSAIWQ